VCVRRGFQLVQTPGVVRQTTMSVDSAPICENMSSSTKPELLNYLSYCIVVTEGPSHVNSIENYVEFRHVVLEICGGQTRHMYGHAYCNSKNM